MERGSFHKHHVITSMRDRARELRKNPTPSEKILWQALRNRQLAGLKFLRQHPIGPTIVDFYCHEKRLAIEVDGSIHRNPDVAVYDRAREEAIQAYGIRFFRCTTGEVASDLEAILNRLHQVLEG